MRVILGVNRNVRAQNGASVVVSHIVSRAPGRIEEGLRSFLQKSDMGPRKFLQDGAKRGSIVSDAPRGGYYPLRHVKTPVARQPCPRTVARREVVLSMVVRQSAPRGRRRAGALRSSCAAKSSPWLKHT